MQNGFAPEQAAPQRPPQPSEPQSLPVQTGAQTLLVKFAVIDWVAFMVTVQGPLPAHAPDHPVKLELPTGLALKETTLPGARFCEQVAVQLMVDGRKVTVPAPVPIMFRVRVYDCRSKLAVTEAAVPMGTVQIPVPKHAPDQPVNIEFASGVAVKVTRVVVGKLAVQVLPQSMPGG